MDDFFAELRRRYIYRIGAVYVVAAWGITQVIDVTMAFGSWLMRSFSQLDTSRRLPTLITSSWRRKGKLFFVGSFCCFMSLAANGCSPHPSTPTASAKRVMNSDIAVELTDFLQVPRSSDRSPPARINYLHHASDGSGRLFVADMRGRIYVIRDGALLTTPFLDIALARSPYFFAEGTENGVTTFAFHPDLAEPGAPGFGKFYTINSERGGLEGNELTPLFHGSSGASNYFKIICEWTVDENNSDQIDQTSRREILRIAFAKERSHSGGQLGFAPNLSSDDPEYGLLYFSVGGGGNSVLAAGKVDVDAEPEKTTNPFGKILRIDPLADNFAPYTVPSTNPFVNRAGFMPEIWAYGLRNPQRFSWDRGGTKKMLIADVGQATVEEINLGKAGANYGWPTYEGNFLIDHQDEKKLSPLPSEALPDGFAFPVAEYDHRDGFSITGGFVYRGQLLPELVGKYIFGDLQTGAIFYTYAELLERGTKSNVFSLKLCYCGRQTTLRDGVLGNDTRVDLRFGLGEDGEIYVLTKRNGMIRKILPHRN